MRRSPEASARADDMTNPLGDQRDGGVDAAGQATIEPSPPIHGGSVSYETLPPHEPSDIRGKWIVAALMAGVLADQALRRPPWHNLATTLLLISLAAAMLTSGFLKQRSAQVAASGSIAFAVMLSLRSDPRLTVFNLLACSFLLLSAAALAERGSVWNYRPLQILTDATWTVYYSFETLVLAPMEVAARIRVSKEVGKHRTAVSALRGVAIAAPILLLLGSLLASADAIFSSFFTRFSIPFGPLVGHAILIVLGVLAATALMRSAAVGNPTPAPRVTFRLGQTEAAVVLGGLVALFGIFAAAQVVGLAGAGEEALQSAGLTFKGYARQGFFQLLWVAALTLATLVSLHVLVAPTPRGRRVLRALSLASVVLTLLIVTVAFGRLVLYVADDGLTPLRFYSAAFSIWVGAAFVLVAARLAGYRPEQAWLMPTLVCSGLMALLALNAINPEAIIANNIVDRDRQSITAHMEKLSGDGLSVVASNVDQLSTDLGQQVTTQLCNRYQMSRGGQLGQDHQPDFLDWNLGTSQGRSALQELCT